jgi:Protein of unknown function (DUF3738)
LASHLETFRVNWSEPALAQSIPPGLPGFRASYEVILNLRNFVKFAVVALLSSPLLAQAPPTHPAPDASAKFIAADVEDPPPAWGAFYFGATIHEDRYILKQATMAHLIATAYNLYQPTYVGDGPAWIWWDRYDIEAKVPPGTTIATARPMLQNLLPNGSNSWYIRAMCRCLPTCSQWATASTT